MQTLSILLPVAVLRALIVTSWQELEHLDDAGGERGVHNTPES